MNRKKSLFVGLDTSAYTTSLAMVDQNENMIYEKRLQLPVKEGALGLRQSDAVFAHLSNMSLMWEEGRTVSGEEKFVSVAASSRPRPIEGSYMPVFKVGEAFGLFLAQTAGLIFLSSSHQEGHIMAGLWSAGLPAARYLVLHLSGGTTEIISAEEIKPGSLRLALLGSSQDLNAGQFIDRIGQAIGLPFPSGPELEKLALCPVDEDITLPLAVKGNVISFSGPASHAERLLIKGCSREALARAVENCIADSLALAVNSITRTAGKFAGILAVGGVTANKHIREKLQEKIEKWPVYYAAPEYSSDNAAGLAVQAARSGTPVI